MGKLILGIISQMSLKYYFNHMLLLTDSGDLIYTLDHDNISLTGL